MLSSTNQSLILDKINLYMEVNERPSYDEKGICQGLTCLYLVKGHEWLNKILTCISNCDDSDILSVGIEIEKLVNAVEFYQNTTKYLQVSFRQSAESAQNILRQPHEPALIKASGISFVFKQDELVKLFSELNYSEPVAISSSDHAMVIRSESGRFYVYDPNEEEIEVRFENSTDLVTFLAKGFFEDFDESAENMPLTIQTFQLCSDPTTHQKLNPSKLSTDTLKQIISSRKATSLSIDMKGPDGVTALFLNAQQGNLEGVNFCLEHGADPNIAFVKSTPLMIAVQNSHADICSALLTRGANPDCLGPNGETTLMNASHLEVAQLLIASKKVNVNVVDSDGSNALRYAIDKGSLAIVELLVKHQITVDHLDIDNNTPLHYAVMSKQYDIAEYLASKSKLIDHKNNDGRTALAVAVINESPRLTEILIKAGAKLTIPVGENEDSVLQVAVVLEALDVMEVLIKSGADVNAENGLKRTPLDDAIEGGNPLIVNCLLLADAKNSDEFKKDMLIFVEKFIKIDPSNLSLDKLEPYCMDGLTAAAIYLAEDNAVAAEDIYKNIFDLTKDINAFRGVLQCNLKLKGPESLAPIVSECAGMVLPNIKVQIFDEGLRVSPTDPELYIGRGRAFILIPDPGGGVEDFKKAANLFEKRFSLNKDLKDFARAIECYVEIKDMDGLRSTVFRCSSLANPEQRVHILEEGLKRNPFDVRLICDLSDAYNLIGEHQKSIDKYKCAEFIKPENKQIKFDIGCQHLILGQDVQALEYFVKSFDPHDSDNCIDKCLEALQKVDHPLGREENFAEFKEFFSDNKNSILSNPAHPKPN
jgi:ankyrin repeat protein